MKHVYFIRHAEAAANVNPDHHGDDQLTPTGHRQVMRLCERAREFSLERVYHSSLPRARETAALLSANLPLPTEELPLVAERVGSFAKSHYDPAESLTDFETRLTKTREFLLHQPHASLAVISHAAFIKGFLAFAYLPKLV